MLRNPGRPLKECASELGKAENTIYMIANSDMFKEYFAQRRREFTERHDFSIQSKLTRVTEASLDALLDNLETKRDRVPVRILHDIASSGLEKLGYGSKVVNPGVQVNIQQNDNRVAVAVDATALEEARSALRLAEQKKLSHEVIETLPEPIFEGETEVPVSVDEGAPPRLAQEGE